ncbi:MAG: hypothetical protein ACI9ON_002658 [Limisphaerales bacterium]|jgi:hypothetical protein
MVTVRVSALAVPAKTKAQIPAVKINSVALRMALSFSKLAVD